MGRLRYGVFGALGGCLLAVIGTGIARQITDMGLADVLMYGLCLAAPLATIIGFLGGLIAYQWCRLDTKDQVGEKYNQP